MPHSCRKHAASRKALHDSHWQRIPLRTSPRPPCEPHVHVHMHACRASPALLDGGCASHAHHCEQAGEDEADAEGEMPSEEEEEEEEEEEGRREGEGGSPGGPSGSEATFVTLGAPNT